MFHVHCVSILIIANVSCSLKSQYQYSHVVWPKIMVNISVVPRHINKCDCCIEGSGNLTKQTLESDNLRACEQSQIPYA